MLPNYWYAVLESNEVKRGKVLGITRFGEKLIVWRNERGEVACAHEKCSHRGVALSAGQVLGDCVECPFHGFQFDSTGRCRVIPANGMNTPVPAVFNIGAYVTREAHDFIWVWYGEPHENLPPLPFFDDIDDTFTHSSDHDHWSVHYTRAVENQLDVAHLPFAHRTTIGRGNRTLVDGPRVVLENDRIYVWVNNRVDDGTPPLKHTELPPTTRQPLLTFIFPSIWQNRLGDDLRIVLAFVPVDDMNCILYLRQYQRVVRTPLLRDVMNLASKYGNRVILGQDRRLVLTELPKKTWSGMDEHLTQSDRPIILYRARRKEILAAAGKITKGAI